MVVRISSFIGSLLLNNKNAISLCMTFLLLLLSSPAQAHWNLNNELSQLNFISIKATHIAEVHSFKELSGSVTPEGVISLEINMASLDTLIPIRDERMGRLLFNITEFPTATFAGQIAPEQMAAIAVGSAGVGDIEGSLTIRDKSQPVSTQILITRIDKRSVQVTTLKPILLNAAILGLGDGVEALREVAGLPSISHAVPVTFTLTFAG